MGDFWKHEGHMPLNFGKFAKFGLTLIILNEIRGLVVAGTIAWQMWG